MNILPHAMFPTNLDESGVLPTTLRPSPSPRFLDLCSLAPRLPGPGNQTNPTCRFRGPPRKQLCSFFVVPYRIGGGAYAIANLNLNTSYQLEFMSGFIK